MRKLTNKEQAEGREFIKSSLKSKYGEDRGWLTIAAKDLDINYTQLSNIVNGKTNVTKALLEKFGYVVPDWISPLGNPWTTGMIIEVEIDASAKSDLKKMLMCHPEYEFDAQAAAIYSRHFSRLVKDIVKNPQAYLRVRDKTAEEQAIWDRACGVGVKSKTTQEALGSDYVPDIAPEDEVSPYMHGPVSDAKLNEIFGRPKKDEEEIDVMG